MLTRRAALPAATVATASAAIADRLGRVVEFSAAKSLCAYVSQGNEVVTHGLIRQVLARGGRVSVPIFQQGRYGTAEIRDFDADLRPGHRGILEPTVAQPGGEPAVWLVPGVAFDEQGHRLGHGKGYFDRLLEGATGLKIGLAFDFQVVGAVPVALHDVRLDYIITEKRTVKGTKHE